MELILEVEEPQILVGIPIVANLRLQSKSAFTLHGRLSFCHGHAGLTIRDSSGNQVSPILEIGCPSVLETHLPSTAKVEYNGVASTSFEFFLNQGEYQVTATYTSLGPYVDHYSETDHRPVEGIWTGALTSNTVKLNVEFPKDEDQQAFLNLGPSPEQLASSPDSLAWFLKTKGEQILVDYPTSNYAAWTRWTWGKVLFDEASTSSVADDFRYQEFMANVDTVEPVRGAAHYREKIQSIVELWYPLYTEFPRFRKRPTVLRGLAQAFIRNGEYKKAIPMINELLEKHAGSKDAKIAFEYKVNLNKKGLWELNSH
jgi:hypothetical protein